MNDRAAETSRGGGSKVKLVVGVVLAIAIVAGVVLLRDKLSLAYLADQEVAFKEFQAAHPLLVFGVAFLVYAGVTGLSIPGAAVLTILYGWLFEWWQAIVLVSFAATTGATIAFLLSRYLFRDTFEAKFGARLEKFNQQLEKEGAFYLFTLRLFAGIPFFLINVVMGLTPIRTWTFWWVSQLGMLPGTMLYTYVGEAAPSLERLAEEGTGAVFSTGQIIQFAIAFGLLGLFPLVAKWIIKKIRPTEERPTE